MVVRPFLLAALVALAGGCTDPNAGRLRLDLDRRDPDPVLHLYFGALLGPNGGDPFAARLLVREDGAVFVNPDVLAARQPPGAPPLDPDGNHRVTDAELDAYVQATYNAARGFPATLAALRLDTTRAFAVSVRGSAMARARRRIYVPESALRAALTRYAVEGQRIVYPAGTLFWGVHAAPDGETTLMQKRSDGAWDYAVYDRAGRLARRTTGDPRPLAAPTQCVGCHLGKRLFEPERSFPAPAPDGPDGPRAIDVPYRDADVAALLAEHRTRADRVLGVYGTAYVSLLRATRGGPDDDALLRGLGL